MTRVERIPITEWNLEREDDPAVIGLLVLTADGRRVCACVRAGLSRHARRLFAEWAQSRVERFLEHGPEPDGWQQRASGGGWQQRASGGGWQLWARLVVLDPSVVE